MKTFKPGDKVRCIEDDPDHTHVGEMAAGQAGVLTFTLTSIALDF